VKAQTQSFGAIEVIALGTVSQKNASFRSTGKNENKLGIRTKAQDLVEGRVSSKIGSEIPYAAARRHLREVESVAQMGH
jgi:hypothetical protein